MDYNNDELLEFIVNQHAVSFYKFIVEYRSELKLDTSSINVLYTENDAKGNTICNESQKRRLLTRCHYTRVYWKYILTSSIDENNYLIKYDCVYNKNSKIDSYKKNGNMQNTKIYITPQTFIKYVFDIRNEKKNRLISYTIVPDHEFNIYVANNGKQYLLQSWIFKYTLKIIHFTKQTQFDTYIYYLHKLLNNNYFSDLCSIENNSKLLYKLFMCHKQSIMRYKNNYLVFTSCDDEYVFFGKNEKKVCITIENTIANTINTINSANKNNKGHKIFDRPNHYNDCLLFDAIENITKGKFDDIYSRKIIEKKYKISYKSGYFVDMYIYKFCYGNNIGNINIMYYVSKNNIFLVKITDDLYSMITEELNKNNNIILNMFFQLRVIDISKDGFGQSFIEMGTDDVNKIEIIHGVEKKNFSIKKSVIDQHNMKSILHILSNAHIYINEKSMFTYLQKMNLYKFMHNIIMTLDIINIGYFYDLLIENICEKSSKAVIIMRAMYFYLLVNSKNETDIYMYMLEILKLDIKIEDITFDERNMEKSKKFYEQALLDNLQN